MPRTLPAAVAALLAVLLAVTTVVTPAAAAEPGRTWAVSQHLGRLLSPPAVDCPTATACWAVEAGALTASTDGGVTWADRSGLLPAVLRALDDIACTGAGTCRIAGRSALGSLLLAVDPGGRTSRVMPAADGPQRLDCATADACVSTDGTTAFRTADAGRTWDTTPLPATVTDPAISCAPGTTVCWVVGGRPGAAPVALRSLDGGATWDARPLPTRVTTGSDLTDVDCVSATVCVVAGAAASRALVLTTRDGGVTWRTTLPAAEALTTVACSTARVCLTVGTAAGAPAAFATTDGTTWTAAAPPAGPTTGDLACAAALRCVLARSGDATRTTGADAGWTTSPLPGSLAGVTSFACVTVAVCTGVGRDLVGRPMTVRGTPGNWTVAPLPAAVGVAADVACAGSSRCVLIATGSGDGSAWRASWSADAGATWTTSTVPAGAGRAVAVTCASATVCLAVYENATGAPRLLRTADGGATWDEAAAPSAATRVDDVSCGSGAGCVLVGETPASAVAWFTTAIGRVVSRTPLADRTAAAYRGVACWATTCLAAGAAADGSGLVARSTDRGATWTTAPAAGGAALDRVACAANGRCALGGTGLTHPLVTTDGGLTWRVDVLAGDRTTGATGCLPDRCFTVPAVADHGTVALAE